MAIIKNLGIWMDYSNAYLIDLNSQKETRTISSSFTTDIKQEVLERSEYTMNNKKEQMNC